MTYELGDKTSIRSYVNRFIWSYTQWDYAFSIDELKL